jgi:hypothetical protein
MVIEVVLISFRLSLVGFTRPRLPCDYAGHLLPWLQVGRSRLVRHQHYEEGRQVRFRHAHGHDGLGKLVVATDPSVPKTPVTNHIFVYVNRFQFSNEVGP